MWFHVRSEDKLREFVFMIAGKEEVSDPDSVRSRTLSSFSLVNNEGELHVLHLKGLLSHCVSFHLHTACS